MKKAILIVSFGTSHRDARVHSLDKIASDIVEISKDIPVIQAYTSGMIVKKLAAEGVKIYTVEEAFQAAILMGAEELYIISTHMIPGIEYDKMKSTLRLCADKNSGSIRKIKIATPVLAEKKDCSALIPVLQEIYGFRDDYEYILMGHGTRATANERYVQMNEAFVKAGFHNIHIASVEAKPDLEDTISILKEKKNFKKIMVHPFMIVAGEHAENDMAGTKDSYITRLEAEGYRAQAIVKGLGEYARFREIFTGKLKELITINQ